MKRRIESFFASFPTPTLSPERDRQIRAALLAAPTPAVPVPSWRPSIVPRFALAFAAVLIAVTSVSGFAYASSGVTRGDVLYPVKRTIERVEGVWQRTPIARVRFHSKLALRRFAELEMLLGQRVTTDRTSFIPVARAASSGYGNGSWHDPISLTASDVAWETSAAVAVVVEISDPAVVKEVTTVLIERQERLEDGLVRAARAVGIERVNRVEAIAQAIEGVREASTTTRVVAAEAAAAAARGVRDVRRTPLPRPSGPTPQSLDAVTIKQKIIEERSEALALGDDLGAVDGENGDAARLLRRVEQKISAADVALNAGDAEQAHRLLDGAIVLRKNAKHFVKVPERVEERQRGVQEDIAAVREDLADAEERLEVLRDTLSTSESLAGASELVAVAHEKLAEAARALAAKEYDRAQTHAATAGLLIDRMVKEMDGVVERDDQTEEALEADVEQEGEAPEERGDEDDDRADRDMRTPKDGGTAVEAEEKGGAGARREDPGSRRGRVKGQRESWDAMGDGAAVVNPETGVRIEFDKEYLRPLTW
ncbi:MAG: hypothetical protein Q7R80_04475 [bacterium]|nr:hypothetical protein [bacterium]